LIHFDMVGTVHVNPTGTNYPATQAVYDAQSNAKRASLLARGRRLERSGLAEASESDHKQVTAGIGQLFPGFGSLAVLRFLPQTITVRAGGTVRFVNRDPETPHTITFGPEPGASPFDAFAPKGTDPSGHHATLNTTTQAVNSGFIGADLGKVKLIGKSFSVTFPNPGTYNYICALHDVNGMVGTVVVTAKTGDHPDED
jgi:plastocyanin